MGIILLEKATSLRQVLMYSRFPIKKKEEQKKYQNNKAGSWKEGRESAEQAPLSEGYPIKRREEGWGGEGISLEAEMFYTQEETVI